MIEILLSMFKSKKGGFGMMMPSGMELPALFIGLILGVVILIAMYHYTGSNLCGTWPPVTPPAPVV